MFAKDTFKHALKFPSVLTGVNTQAHYKGMEQLPVNYQVRRYHETNLNSSLRSYRDAGVPFVTISATKVQRQACTLINLMP
ncbi:hypothetical protein GCM10007391_20340 [Alteromonas halophila]|uniref:Uncharacterized protein n=1 Tax=Alteromonas halophila TaxID=516698 RepID=A0A918JL34_9ALTE|nr:hypothetical protein GCM10007391_20340 [Alteromonas halophila]